MQILPRVVPLRAGVLMLWPAAPAPHRVSLTGTPLVCCEPLIFTESFLLYHMYKLGREGVNRDEGENERERDQRD